VASVALIGLRMAWRDSRAVRLLAVSSGIVAGSYVVAGWLGRGIAEWYLVAFVPILVVSIFVAIQALGRRCGPEVAVGAASLLLTAQLAGLDWRQFPDPSFLKPRAAIDERERVYLVAGERLRRLVRENDVVAAPEIGALGYTCDCTILDTVGLVTPEALVFYPLSSDLLVINNAIPPALIRHLKPSFVASLDVFMLRSALRDPVFTRTYEVMFSLPATSFGSRQFLTYRRRAEATTLPVNQH